MDEVRVVDRVVVMMKVLEAGLTVVVTGAEGWLVAVMEVGWVVVTGVTLTCRSQNQGPLSWHHRGTLRP